MEESPIRFIPVHILEAILSKAPAKSVLRFRCISKSCNAFITSPSFISLHIKAALANKNTTNNPKLVLGTFPSFEPTRGNHTLYHEIDELLVPDQKFKYTFHDRSISTNYVECLGSCNGVICMHYIDHDKVTLWNPAIRKSLTIPFTEVDNSAEHYRMGFWFDIKTSDYKIITLVQANGDRRQAPKRVQLYELNRNSWRSIATAPVHINSQAPSFLNGNLHWFGYSKIGSTDSRWCNRVVLFQVTNEVFGDMELPEGYLTHALDPLHRRLSTSMLVLGELLSLVEYWSTRVEIWVMKEYGVTESWSRFYNISMDNIGRVYGLIDIRKVLGLKLENKLVLYEPETRSKLLTIDRAINAYAADYLDTLSLLNRT
ncbi:hypothetical protein K2173_023858 [Erythroxylum novogranatense]|uniref:F-box domain-containing protein n=1 Tax=Erythroxylum novogranatense TaxID=1862640 RepID=A0AAV8TRN2_9ROSI|nr:hypothetical protein K2173_023858 [Erythroxylum novogranatense]